MAGGPVYPSSIVYPSTGEAFPNLHSVQTNERELEGIGVEASLGADVDVQLDFTIPTVLPSGQCKLVLEGMANAASGIATINPQWKSWAPEEDQDVAKSTYPTAEGEETITWASGDEDVTKQNKIDLDADTVVAGETIHMYAQLIQASSKWTVAARSTWKMYLVWEDA